MKKNIGTPGRILRFIFALLLLVYAIWQKSWIAGAAALFVFFEVYASWCIWYQIIGKNTCPISKDKD